MNSKSAAMKIEMVRFRIIYKVFVYSFRFDSFCSLKIHKSELIGPTYQNDQADWNKNVFKKGRDVQIYIYCIKKMCLY